MKFLVRPVLGLLLWSVLCCGQGQAQTEFPQLKRLHDGLLQQLSQFSRELARPELDFEYQGEYFAAVAPEWGCENVGLQVIALGAGRFDAVLMRGGLPGAGWDRQVTRKLSGARQNERVLLTSDEFEMELQPQQVVVRRPQGQHLATLPRMHRVSPTLGAQPPWGASILFDGSSTEQLQGGKMTDDGLLQVGFRTAAKVRDFRLHVEFRTPFMPYATGQGRGNSGVYIQQRYEVQVLDSFGLAGKANECGGLYKQRPPAVNMCLPPMSWQTYDILFRAARFDASGNKRENAQITVAHNGQLIHDRYELPKKTGAGRQEGPEPMPILFQDHGNPVHYRNIWLLPLPDAAAHQMPLFNVCAPCAVQYCR